MVDVTHKAAERALAKEAAKEARRMHRFEAAEAKRAAAEEKKAAARRAREALAQELKAATQAKREARQQQKAERDREKERLRREKELEGSSHFNPDITARWVSLDLAVKVSGYALWAGRKLVEVGEIRPAHEDRNKPWHPFVRVVVAHGKTYTFSFRNERLAYASLFGSVFYNGELVASIDDIQYAVFEGTYPHYFGAFRKLVMLRQRVEDALRLTDDTDDPAFPPHFRYWEVQKAEWQRSVTERIPGFVWVSEGHKIKGEVSSKKHKATAIRVVESLYPHTQLGERHDVAEAVLVGLWFDSAYLSTAKRKA